MMMMRGGREMLQQLSYISRQQLPTPWTRKNKANGPAALLSECRLMAETQIHENSHSITNCIHERLIDFIDERPEERSWRCVRPLTKLASIDCVYALRLPSSSHRAHFAIRSSVESLRLRSTKLSSCALLRILPNYGMKWNETIFFLLSFLCIIVSECRQTHQQVMLSLVFFFFANSFFSLCSYEYLKWKWTLKLWSTLSQHL